MMKIIKRPDGSRNYVTDQSIASFLDYNGRISIEIRGSSSQDLPKKGYGLTTLEDDNSTNNNVSLLGMPAENDWVLNGLAFDPSLIRDYLSYNLARAIGDYAPRTAFCELVVNGSYCGLYLLQEKIKADSGRVNILKITDTDVSGENLTGGYITKADKTTGGDPVAWTMLSYNGTTDYIHELPKPENVTPQQNSYIHGRFTALALTAQFNSGNIATGYPSYIDIPTFVDFMIINELASNADAYQLSTYFHQDRNGKLRAGPIWDHNLTYGNDLFDYGLDRSHYDVWQFDNGDNTGSRFWKDLFNSSTFKCYLSRRWNELIGPEQPLKHSNLVSLIDSTVALISEASVREQVKWGTVPDLAGEIDNMKIFLYQRINWMTSHLGSYSACADPVLPPLVISKINYNPDTNGSFPVSNDQEFIEITNNGTASVDLTGVYFRELGISYQFPSGSQVAGGGKIYLASNPAVFQSRYGIAAFGKFTRNLSNNSQKLLLADAFGNTIDTVEYDDDAPWPDADGNGSYLQLMGLELDNSLASSWTASPATTLAAPVFSTSAFSIVPNPASHFIHISSNMPVSSFEIADLSGRVVFSKKPADTDFDVSFLPAGIYIIKLSVEGKSQVQKLIKN